MTFNRAWAVLLVGVSVWAFFVQTGSAGAAAPADLPSFDPLKPLSEEERNERMAALAAGLSPEQVRRLIGAPRHISRQILYHRWLEQWMYDGAFSLRLEFEGVRGSEPRLQSVQSAGGAGR